MQIRVNAESAAFFRAGENELYKTNDKLGKLIRIQLRLTLFEYPLNCEYNFISVNQTHILLHTKW